MAQDDIIVSLFVRRVLKNDDRFFSLPEITKGENLNNAYAQITSLVKMKVCEEGVIQHVNGRKGKGFRLCPAYYRMAEICYERRRACLSL